MSGPLTDLRVLDLSRVMAGPWCTQILADLGAEVIKVERPGSGDETRAWGPPWLRDADGNETRESAYFLSANRGKYSLTVDMARPEGRRIILELADRADVLVENFRRGSLAGKGLAYQDVRKRNPGIVYCSITGFGQTGPRADEAGYDYLIQALGGLMSITGIEDGKPGAGPLRVGLPVADLATGLYAAVAILAALHHRIATGTGQYIDLSLLDTQISLLSNQAQNYFTSGACPTRTGTQHPNLAPYQPFRTRDGTIVIAIGNDSQFRRFCGALGRPDLADDERFAGNSGRVGNRALLAEILEGITATRDSDEWIAICRENAIPCGPIQTIEQVFGEPQVRHRAMQVELDHPLAGQVHCVANPIRYSVTPIEYRKAPPLLGQDTDTVLREILGKQQTEIDALRVAGVLGGAVE